MEFFDKQDRPIALYDWVNYVHSFISGRYRTFTFTCQVIYLNDRSTSSYLDDVCNGAIGILVPKIPGVWYKWDRYPKVRDSMIDKSSQLQHDLYWIFPYNATKIDNPSEDLFVQGS